MMQDVDHIYCGLDHCGLVESGHSMSYEGKVKVKQGT